jgi:cyclopropane-fatty-acyl-phospholipid synthase
MIWQQRMQRLASHLRQHSPLPARLVWDGQAIDFGLFEQPLVTMHIRKPAGLRYLLSPRLDHLGEAYVRGLVDIEGKLDDIIDMALTLLMRVNGNINAILDKYSEILKDTGDTVANTRFAG